MESQERKKRPLIVADDEHCEISPESKRLRSDILGILEDDADLDEEERSRTGSTPDELLNSVMRSLQNEINGEVACSASRVHEQPDLGYLLEASDDELGLPPPESVEEAFTEDLLCEIRTSSGSEVADLAGFWELDEAFPGFEMPEYVLWGADAQQDEVEEHLFDFTDASSSADWSSVGLWMPESMPSACL